MKFSGTKKFSLNSKRIKILSPETNKRNKTHCLKKQRNTKSQETKKHEVSRSKKYVWRYKKHETKYGG